MTLQKKTKAKLDEKKSKNKKKGSTLCSKKPITKKFLKKDNFQSISKEIIAEISDVCFKNESLFLHIIQDNTAILTKKITVTTVEVNENSIFQPVESRPERTFFHTFIVTWKDKNKFLKSVSGSILYFGFPIYYVKSLDELSVVIKAA